MNTNSERKPLYRLVWDEKAKTHRVIQVSGPHMNHETRRRVILEANRNRRRNERKAKREVEQRIKADWEVMKEMKKDDLIEYLHNRVADIEARTGVKVEVEVEQ